MVKTIKFPLDMGEDAKVRTIEDLRERFDTERLVGHFVSGKLQIWLSDRHYKAELEAVEKLSVNNENLVRELCQIFRIEQEPEALEVNTILEKQRLQKELRQFTDDAEILNHPDRVAVNQVQLDVLLEQKYSVIYLFGEHFRLKKDIRDVRLYGVNEPVLEFITDEVIDFESLNVEILNSRFDEKYSALQERKKIEEESKYKRKKGTYKASKEFDYKLSKEERQGSEKLYIKIQEEFGDFKFDIDAGSRGIYEVLKNADIRGIFDIDRYGAGIKRKLEEADLNAAWTDYLDRIS